MTSSSEIRLLRLVKAGIVTSYSQRIQIAFSLLDPLGTGFFKLKDLLEKRKFIFGYLCFKIDHEKSFPVMDFFRQIDFDGSGKIDLIEFASGIAEKIRELSSNDELLESIAMELMPAGSKSASEILLLMDGDENELPHSYRVYMQAFAYLVEDRIIKSTAQYQLKQTSSPATDSIGISSCNGSSTSVMSRLHTPNRGISSPMRSRTISADGLLLQDDVSTDAEHQALKTIISLDKLTMFMKDSIKQAVIEVALHFHFSKSRCLTLSLFQHFDLTINAKKKDAIAAQDNLTVDQVDISTAAAAFHLKPVVCRWRRKKSKGKIEMPHAHSYDIQKNQQEVIGKTFSDINILSTTNTDEIHTSALAYLQEFNVLERLKNQPITEENSLDSGQLFILQNISLAIDGFFSLMPSLNTSAIGNQPIDEAPVSTSTIPPEIYDKLISFQDTVITANSNEELKGFVSDASPSCATLARELMCAQQKLQKARIRLDTLSLLQTEIIRVHQIKESANNLLTSDAICFDDVLNNEGNCKLNAAFPNNEVDINDSCTFDDVMQELIQLKSCSAYRGTDRSVLGYLLATPCVVIPTENETLPKFESLVSVTDVAGISNKGKSGNYNELVSTGFLQSLQYIQQLALEGVGKAKDLRISDERQLSNNPSQNSFVENEITGDSSENKTIIANSTLSNPAISDQKVAEFSLLREQVDDDRTAMIHMAVELQILREKALKLEGQENIANELRLCNRDLQRQVATLEKQLQSTAAIAASSKADGLTTIGGDLSGQDAASDQTKILSKQLAEITAKMVKLEKENKRISLSIKQSEQRMTTALHENLTLRQRLGKAEDELTASKTFETQLQQDIAHERSLRVDRDLIFAKYQELQREVNSRDQEMNETREQSGLLKKMKEELERAEDRVTELVEEASRMHLDLERSAEELRHMEEYNLQIREQAKTIREQSLKLRTLESQLAEIRFYQTRHDEIAEELQLYKLKVEKIPALLADNARLRASSRAAIKALADQDKAKVDSKQKVKELEREINTLKVRLKQLQDTESKLKDANEKIRDLTHVAGELTALKEGAKNAEEDRKTAETHMKKIKKAMRQSVFVGAEPSKT